MFYQDRERTRPKYVPKLFSPEGRPYNVNQAKVSFTLNDEDDRERIILEVAAYRHLDTAHLDVDVQPRYVRVTIKGKVLQLALPCEVSTDRSEAKRNVTTGNLVITMPRLNPLAVIGAPVDRRRAPTATMKQQRGGNKVVRRQAGPVPSKRELLEIGPPTRDDDDDDMDFSRIYVDPRNQRTDARGRAEKSVSEDFVDDPDVPPLE